MKVLEAVVLAGGSGNRIRETLGDTPKALADIHGKVLLERKLDELRANGVMRTHILTGIGHVQVSHFLKHYRRSHPDFEILEYFDGHQPLGTGGALFNVLTKLPSKFFLTYGDTLLDLDYSDLVRVIHVTGLPHAISTTTKPSPSDLWNCKVSDQRLLKYDKSGDSDMNSTDYGLILFSRDPIMVEMENEIVPFDLAPIISRLAARGQISAVLTNKRYLEIGTPKALNEVRKHFRLADE